MEDHPQLWLGLAKRARNIRAAFLWLTIGMGAVMCATVVGAILGVPLIVGGLVLNGKLDRLLKDLLDHAPESRAEWDRRLDVDNRAAAESSR